MKFSTKPLLSHFRYAYWTTLNRTVGEVGPVQCLVRLSALVFEILDIIKF